MVKAIKKSIQNYIFCTEQVCVVDNFMWFLEANSSFHCFLLLPSPPTTSQFNSFWFSSLLLRLIISVSHSTWLLAPAFSTHALFTRFIWKKTKNLYKRQIKSVDVFSNLFQKLLFLFIHSSLLDECKDVKEQQQQQQKRSMYCIEEEKIFQNIFIVQRMKLRLQWQPTFRWLHWLRRFHIFMLTAFW